MIDLEALKTKLSSAIEHSSTLQEAMHALTGKDSLLNEYRNEIKLIPVENRGNLFQKLEELKDDLLKAIQAKFAKPLNLLDVTLPTWQKNGQIHILTHTINELRTIMSNHGFIEGDAPCIDTEDNNFTDLNIDSMHPARDSHDTFYLNSGKLLRTQTSNYQIHFLKSKANDPSKEHATFHVGRTYRRDSDSTHSPMFHQMECMWISPKVNFSHLKWLLRNAIQTFFQSTDLQIRFRPSYFPFTEPSIEADILGYISNRMLYLGNHPQAKWHEILGAGMIRRNILEKYNYYDTTGFALAFGIERFAMLKYGVSNIHDFYKNKYPFLQSFCNQTGSRL